MLIRFWIPLTIAFLWDYTCVQTDKNMNIVLFSTSEPIIASKIRIVIGLVRLSQN